MSFGKELLLSCTVMMAIFFVPLQALDIGKLRENMKGFDVALENLLMAEQDYVKLIFSGTPPTNYTSRHLQGITLPVGNTTKEIQDSVCAISDHLDNHLPAIIRNVTDHQGQLIDNIKIFHNQFKEAVKLARTKQDNVPCGSQRYVTALPLYRMKVIGLRIIYYTRRWVEDFTNTTLI